jgi:large subunit ribosomal protein L14
VIAFNTAVLIAAPSIPNRRLKRRLITKNIYLALLVAVRQQLRRPQGHYIRMSTNRAVLLTPQGKLLGTRLYGPVADEVRAKGLAKLVSMAKALV